MNLSHSCFGISTKLDTAQLPQSLFHKIAAEELRSGKSNSVELYSEALNELEVNQCCNVFSEDSTFFANKFLTNLSIQNLRKFN